MISLRQKVPSLVLNLQRYLVVRASLVRYTGWQDYSIGFASKVARNVPSTAADLTLRSFS